MPRYTEHPKRTLPKAKEQKHTKRKPKERTLREQFVATTSEEERIAFSAMKHLLF